MLVGETLCRICIVLLGYVYPAYQSYKAVNLGSPELLRQWCIYWLVLGSFLSVEWLADLTIFWLPLYYEAKLAFIVLCWHPRTRGAVYLFDRAIKPLLGRHEARIDSFVEESKTRAVDALTSQVNRVKGYLHGNTSVILEGLRQFSEQDAGPVPVSTHPLDEHPGWPASDGLKRD